MRIVSESELDLVLRSEAALYPNMRIAASNNLGTPRHLLTLVDKAIPEYRVFAANANGPFADRPGVTLETFFIGPGMRGKKNIRYFPCRLSMARQLVVNDPPEIVLIQTSVPHNGRVSLGIEVALNPTLIEECHKKGGIVIAQMNKNMPYTYGDGEYELDEIDFGIYHDETLIALQPVEPGDIDKAIAGNVRPLMHDGNCLQGGIGPRVDAIMSTLTDLEDLTVWSEMGSDWVMNLSKAGALDPRRAAVMSFAAGSVEFYKWLHLNPIVKFGRTELVNDPAIIAENEGMVSINTALQVDLYGQVNASYAKGRYHSGFGGALDFHVGAMHAKGGLTIVILPAVHPKALESTIVPMIEGPVTSIQPNYIITENGAAKIIGNDLQTQHREMIAIADPAAEWYLNNWVKFHVTSGVE